MAETQTTPQKKARRAPPPLPLAPEPGPPRRRRARTPRSATCACRRARCGWSRTSPRHAGRRRARHAQVHFGAAAKPLAKLLRSAVANAEQKGGRVDVDALVVKTLNVDQGPKMRRFMPRAQGRAFRVEKKTSHVYVELGTAARG